MPPRLLILTQWFDPEPTPKGMLFAKSLLRRGFKVEVVTGFPNYPGGKLYSGYRLKLLQKELIDGISITRIPLYPSHDRSAAKRIMNYLSFGATALFYCLLGARRPDIVYVYHPPLTVALVGAFLRILRRVPVVLDIQDIWPDTLLSTGMLLNKIVLSIIDHLCNWVYRQVDRIVVLSPGFKRLLLQRGVTNNKTAVIYNWCDEPALSNLGSDLPIGFPEDGCFRIMFAGTMGKAQALDAVLDAAEIISKKTFRISFVFIGGGIEVNRLKHKAGEKNLSNVVFLPRVSMSQVGSLLKRADALLVHLRKDPLFKITIPSKTQAYMAIGKPILMAVEGDAADLINSAKCGIVAISENPEAIAAAAIELFEMNHDELLSMGHRAKAFYFKNLSLDKGISTFSGIFFSLINKAQES